MGIYISPFKGLIFPYETNFIIHPPLWFRNSTLLRSWAIYFQRGVLWLSCSSSSSSLTAKKGWDVSTTNEQLWIIHIISMYIYIYKFKSSRIIDGLASQKLLGSRGIQLTRIRGWWATRHHTLTIVARHCSSKPKVILRVSRVTTGWTDHLICAQQKVALLSKCYWNFWQNHNHYFWKFWKVLPQVFPKVSL